MLVWVFSYSESVVMLTECSLYKFKCSCSQSECCYHHSHCPFLGDVSLEIERLDCSVRSLTLM